jgi:predicted RNase H-like nuclease (RuvC/YqgF family)
MNIANEVSSIVSEVESLRAENHVLKRANEMLEFEKDQLTKALGQARTERDHHMIKKGELKALLDGAGNFLVSGIRKYHDEQLPELETTATSPPLRLAVADKAAE